MKNVIFGALALTMVSSAAHAACSDIPNPTRFNPTELSDYQECWLDTFQSDEIAGVLGSIAWVKLDGQYFSASLSEIRKNPGSYSEKFIAAITPALEAAELTRIHNAAEDRMTEIVEIIIDGGKYSDKEYLALKNTLDAQTLELAQANLALANAEWALGVYEREVARLGNTIGFDFENIEDFYTNEGIIKTVKDLKEHRDGLETLLNEIRGITGLALDPNGTNANDAYWLKFHIQGIVDKAAMVETALSVMNTDVAGVVSGGFVGGFNGSSESFTIADSGTVKHSFLMNADLSFELSELAIDNPTAWQSMVNGIQDLVEDAYNQGYEDGYVAGFAAGVASVTD